MQTNLAVKNHNTSFGIKTDKNLIKAVHNYYNGVEHRPWRAENFNKLVIDMEKKLGYDDFELIYKRGIFKNGNKHIIYATKEGMNPVVITQKDEIRKVIEKLNHLNKHELYTKIHNAQVAQGLK